MSNNELTIKQGFKLLEKLIKAGLKPVDALAIIQDAEDVYARRVVDFVQRGIYKAGPLNIGHELAREIMDENFFGIDDALKHFQVDLSRSRLAALSEIPYSREALEEKKDTHILTAIFPISIFEIREKVDPGLFNKKSWEEDNDVYWKDSFVFERSEPHWQLLRKTPAEKSTNKTWLHQQLTIGDHEEVPTAQAVVYTIIGHYLNTGECLFHDLGVRTATKEHILTYRNLQLYNYYGQCGIRFNPPGDNHGGVCRMSFLFDDRGHPNVGLSSVWKP